MGARTQPGVSEAQPREHNPTTIQYDFVVNQSGLGIGNIILSETLSAKYNTHISILGTKNLADCSCMITVPVLISSPTSNV